MKNGILNLIASPTGTVYELRDHFFNPDAHYYALKKVGLVDALTMNGFCSSCDSKLFSQIEVPTPAVPSEKADALRYSVRPVLNELRKKSGNMAFFDHKPDGPRKFKHKGIIYNEAELEKIGLVMLEGILADLFDDTAAGKFTHYLRRLPRRDLCASAILVRPIKFDVRNIAKAALGEVSVPVSFNIINIFPVKDESVLCSVTYAHDVEGNAFHEMFDCVSDVEAGRIVTNMLIAQIEDWAVSEKLYKSLPAKFFKSVNDAKKVNGDLFFHDFEMNIFDDAFS